MEKQGMTLPRVVRPGVLQQEEAVNRLRTIAAGVGVPQPSGRGLSPYPKLQSNTSSHVQSDADNNYLNWGRASLRRWDSIPE